MAKVFLSYDREDLAKAKSVASYLEEAGHAVWWDRNIRGGAQYSKEIERALEDSDAVVVLWSAASVNSEWVRDEAAEGRDRGRLIPVLLEPVKPPMGFRQFQTIDVTDWSSKPSKRAPMLLDALSTGATAPQRTPPESNPHGSAMAFAWNRRSFAILAMLALVIAASVTGLLTGGSAAAPTVSVTAADSNPLSQTVARDLLLKLGVLQASATHPITIVDVKPDKEADFEFAVSGASEAEGARASVALLSSKDGAILWSKDFVQPSGKTSDLQQQVAYSSARVLECALETQNPDEPRLKQTTLRSYLNGCAQLDEVYGQGGRNIIPIFTAVLDDAPTFKAGWAKLLLAEATFAGWQILTGTAYQQARQVVRQHIAAARKLDPNMPEATVAEVGLLPYEAFEETLRLLDKALALHHENAALLSTRAGALRTVGRMRESIEDSRRASQLDPLSPSTRGAYVMALLYAGRLDAARRELEQFEKLWPGTQMLQELQFRYHLRFGDPKKALHMTRTLDIGGDNSELFLLARIDPSRVNIDRFFADARQDDINYVGIMAQAMGEFHREDQLYELLESWPNREDIVEVGDLWFRPALKRFRQDPRFMKLADKIGLVDYWRRSGHWPDFCREPDLSYDCKKEAAKLSA